MYVNIHNIHKLFHFEIQTKKSILRKEELRGNCFINTLYVYMNVCQHAQYAQANDIV